MPALHHQLKPAQTLILGLLLAAFPSLARGQNPPPPNYHPPAVFSHPTAVTNPYMPYAGFKQDILTGVEEGKPSRVVRTRFPGTKTSWWMARRSKR